MEWLGEDVSFMQDNLDIDTFEISKNSMDFIRENYITVTDFADKIVKIPRANVSLYFNNPIPWIKASSALRVGIINVMFWLDLEPNRRLENLEHAETANLPILVDLPQKSYIDEAKAIVAEVKENATELNKYTLDTLEIAKHMKMELRKANICLKNFAKIVQVNRNYFASLINSPLTWETTTNLQKFVYQSMNAWITHRQKNILPNFQPRMALKPLNVEMGQNLIKNQIKRHLNIKERNKQKRIRFTQEQRQYLLDYFKKNPRPDHNEKQDIAKKLNLSIRTVMIFFCNRRTRLNLSQKN